MSKNQNKLNLDVEIKKYVPTQDDIEDYIIAQRLRLANTPKASLTMNQYLKDKYFSDEAAVVTADLSNRIFGKDGIDKVTDQITDLSGGDFTGCILKNTVFQGCDLAEAVFCDVDFDNAYFQDTKLKNINFKGADLSNCSFSKNYKDYEQLGKRDDIAGIKFSTTSSLGRIYADVKSDLFRQQEQKALIESKTKELNEAYKKLSYVQVAYIIGGRETGNLEYDRLNKELKAMTEEKKFPRKNDAMHESFQNIFASEASSFDPAYVRGSTKEQREVKTQYVSLTREDIKQYLTARKADNKLSLNDYAKAKLDKPQVESGVRIIADCSSKVDNFTNNEWSNRLDLSGLDFSGADLSGAVFAGSDLSSCIFHNSNISRANFESANMKSADFKDAKAGNTNFFNSNLSNVAIDHSQFPYAFMVRSNGQEIKVNESNFDYANIKNGQWDKAKLADSTFQHANLEGLSLISAELRKVQMQHAILDKAVLTECQIIESDLSNAFMREVQAQKAKFENTILEKIEAKKIDLSEAELDAFTKLDGANLEAAILRKIKAEGVSFVKANMDMVEAQQADFKGAILEGVNIRFADLTEAILEGAKAQGINASYSSLEKVKAQKADFSNGIMRRIQGQQADFTEVNFTNTDLTRSKLRLAILEKVQAEKARLEGVDLQKAKLAEANLAKATVDEKTILVGAEISGIKGSLMRDGQEITPQQLQTDQVIMELEQQMEDKPDMFEQVGTSVFDLLKIIGPAIGSVTELPSLYNNFREFQKTSQALLSDKLLVGERRKLQEKRVEHISNLIQGASNVLGKMPNSPQSDLVKDALAKYVMFPVLGAAINPAPMITLTESRRINPDIFEGVNKEFGRSLVPVLLNLVRSALERESARKIQDICQEALIPSENSVGKIVDEAVEILVNPKLVKVIKDELVPFLRAPDNQREITKIVENVLDAKFTKTAPKELLANTVSMVTNVGSDILTNIPEIAAISKSYGQHQKLSLELWTSEELTDQRKEVIKQEQKLEVRDILDKSEKILADMSANLQSTIPGYLSNNSEDILSVLQTPEIQRSIENYGLNPEFVHKAARATMPFIADILPVIADLAENCLKDKKGLGEIIEQFTDLMNLPESEQQLSKIGKLTDSLIKFKNDNQEIKDILQEKLAALLIKHAETLGPVVEEFLAEKVMGKKLKLKGKKLLEALGVHTGDLGKIGAAYSQKKYSLMIRPLWKLLTDKKVLNIAVKSLVNLTQYFFQKHFVSNFMREKIIGGKMNQFMSDISSAESDKKQDLSAIFQRKSGEYSKSPDSSSSLVYSLEHKDLTGLSFEKTDLKLGNFEIQGFNFDKTKLGKCSFKDSVLQDCSFSETSFKGPVEFDGAVIDGETLSSLLPTINKHNRKYPERTIKLDKIKIVGEISEEIKGNPLLKGADFVKATVISLKDSEAPKHEIKGKTPPIKIPLIRKFPGTSASISVR